MVWLCDKDFYPSSWMSLITFRRQGTDACCVDRSKTQKNWFVLLTFFFPCNQAHVCNFLLIQSLWIGTAWFGIALRKTNFWHQGVNVHAFFTWYPRGQLLSRWCTFHFQEEIDISSTVHSESGKKKEEDLIFISPLMEWISWMDILQQPNEATQLAAEIWNILRHHRREDSNLLSFSHF